MTDNTINELNDESNTVEVDTTDGTTSALAINNTIDDTTSVLATNNTTNDETATVKHNNTGVYKHRVYVQRRFTSGNDPHVFWNLPNDFNTNPNAYLTLTMVFKEYIDRNIDNKLMLYVLHADNTVYSVYQEFPDMTKSNRMLLCVSFVAPANSAVKGSDTTASSGTRLHNTIVHRYPNLTKDLIAEVVRLEDHSRRMDFEIKRLTIRLNHMHQSRYENDQRVALLTSGDAPVLPDRDASTVSPAQRTTPRKKRINKTLHVNV